jgi:hypothetical protein
MENLVTGGFAQPHRFEELMLINRKPRGGFAMRKDVWRAVIEVGFIIFLFYSNLLMGEFERSGLGRKRGLAWAIEDVVSSKKILAMPVRGVRRRVVTRSLIFSRAATGSGWIVG